MQRSALIRFSLLWGAASVLAGVVTGGLGVFLADIPFYVGFLFGWVLTGLTAFFVLAARMSQKP